MIKRRILSGLPVYRTFPATYVDLNPVQFELLLQYAHNIVRGGNRLAMTFEY